MTPHSTGGRRGGNLEIDRQITQLGATRVERRIRVSLGTKDTKKLDRLNTIIDKAIENEDFELLRALRDGKIHPLELIEADRKEKTRATLGKVKLNAYLWDRDVDGTVHVGAISKALTKVPGQVTRDRYVDTFKALQRKAEDELGPDAMVADLLDVDWNALYKKWGASDTDWAHLKQALSRFATLHTNDKWDPFARQLRQVIPYKAPKKRKPKLSIEQFIEITNVMPPHAAASVWVLAITGVRVGEYLRSTAEHLDASSHSYDVPGTKNAPSAATVRVDERWWIYLERGIPSRLRYGWLRKYWTRACVLAGVGRRVGTGKFVTKLAPSRPGPKAKDAPPRQKVRVERTRYVGPTLHDLRHCHGQWAIDAGVAESKVQGSLRHANPNQTRDYVMVAGTLDVSSALADRLLEPVKPKRGKRA